MSVKRTFDRVNRINRKTTGVSRTEKCSTADEVAVWVWERHGGLGGHGGQTEPSASTYPELATNAALVLLAVACSLLDRQLAALAAAL